MINNFRPLISDDIAARALVAPVNRLRDEMIYIYLIIDNCILLLWGTEEEDGKPLDINIASLRIAVQHTHD